MMSLRLGSLCMVLALLCLHVQADCASYGVDFSNGGSYYIDGSSSQYFSFITVFEGCTEESINPILVGPDNNNYACSAIDTTPAGAQVTSTCGIPYSLMTSGTWKIIVQGNQIAVQRTISLTVGVPQTTTVTVTPTIVLGITSTPKAITVFSTILQTQTLILVPSTITAPCNSATQTVTSAPAGSTITVTSIVTRTVTDGSLTSQWTTTVTETATCHYQTTTSSASSHRTTSTTISPDTNPFTSAQPSWCIGRPDCIPFWTTRGGGGGGWGWLTRRPPAAEPTGSNKDDELEKREVAATAAVAAVTTTYTETTYTVTRTSITTLPAQTTTEVVLKTVTATITPAPSTKCSGGGAAGTTVTITKGNPTTVTVTNISYKTTHISGTVWIGQTQYTTYTNSASATACWQAGGWMGP